MYTVKEFRRLKAGTRVAWREGVKIADIGIVKIEGDRHFVRWPDGQETDGSDDWALEKVEAHFSREVPA